MKEIVLTAHIAPFGGKMVTRDFFGPSKNREREWVLAPNSPGLTLSRSSYVQTMIYSVSVV